MKIVSSLAPVSLGAGRPVAAIGIFDGVHLGHRLLLERARAAAGTRRPLGVLTFVPPAGSGQGEERLLTTLEERLELLASRGVDICWAVRLEDELAGMSPREFVEGVVSRRLGLSGVAVGRNFRFGRGRTGDSALLKSLGAEAGVEVLVVSPLAVAGRRVCSSLIRDLVERGEVEKVPAFLGRCHSVSGTVEPGDGRGRKWGYPTANFVPRQLPPAPGVYAAAVESGGRRLGAGLYYRGFRPTLGSGVCRNEAHVFDWDGDLYGREIKVYLLSKIRQDIRFDSVPELLARLRTDEKIARMRLKTEKNSEKRNEEEE